MMNKYYSYNNNALCKGCKLCVQGRKSVIYITGLCPRKCYYCPLSDNRRNKDVMFANERPVSDVNEIIEEVKVSGSKGAGITGGDPLLFVDRTVKTIKALKQEFGKMFHIHLYTSLTLATKERLRKLYNAGLDEIRFHPDLEDNSLWERISIARRLDWKIGVEIPVIPGIYDMTWELVKRCEPHIDFINLNELEISDTNGCKLLEKGFRCKDEYSYAIKGSHDMALRLLRKIKEDFPKLAVHYCTSKLKDKVQMANRLKLRAKNAAKELDWVDEEGMVIRGFIEGSEGIMEKIKNEFKIPKKFIEYDSKRKQVLVAPWILMEISKDITEKCGIVKEYPTWDRMIVERDYLKT